MILRWLNSLTGRLTLSIVLAIVIAQVIGVLAFARQQERERGQQVSETFFRQVVGLVDLFNSNVSDLNRARYMQTVRAPGLQFWLSEKPAIKTHVPALDAEAPRVSLNWQATDSADKRIVWFPDPRPLTARYGILQPMDGRKAPTPEEVAKAGKILVPDDLGDRDGAREPGTMFPGRMEGPSAGGPGRRPPSGRPPPDRTDALSAGPGDAGGPPSGVPRGMEGPPGQAGDAPDGLLVDNGIVDVNAGAPPPMNRRPDVRWRVSVLLQNGTWLNAEHLYDPGLPSWLRQVLYQNGVILAFMLLLVVPAVSLATRRVKLLVRAADKLGRGENSEPLPESGTTEIRQLTQAFNSMSLRLRRFVQGRTEMLAGISHDLRTPITALRLRADLVDDDENRERMQALITDMQHLTEATLTLAKDESFTEKSDKVDVSTLIEGICDDLNDAGIDAQADVERGVILHCRPFSLRRAIRNLAENGAKYGKRSRIHMNGDERNVRIIVDDDGPGIPEDLIEKAFQPFVRLEGSRSRETGGSGLGLAITRSIVLNHGGELKLANRAEGGLRAVMTLPREFDQK